MRKRLRLVIAGIGVVLCLTAWQVLRPKELVYRGKRVSEWVEIYCRDGQVGSNAHLHFRAVCNLIDLGTNSAPFILKMAATHDSDLKKLVLKVPIPDKLLDCVHLKASYKRWASAAVERPRMATRAFQLIGRQNKCAVPGLIELLSSDNPWSRVAAAEMLQAVGPQAQEALPALASIKVRDLNAKVRAAAAKALVAITSGESAKPNEVANQPLLYLR